MVKTLQILFLYLLTHPIVEIKNEISYSHQSALDSITLSRNYLKEDLATIDESTYLSVSKHERKEKIHFFIFKISVEPGVDPTKLFFFDKEEFLRFSLVSLHFCNIQKKIIDFKMT
jgi:hypothetical protein